jgi:hypothetical protein
MQRIVGIALGYEDLIEHDQLRHDPVLAVLAGKLTASRTDCAPLAGKSTLNRLELSQAEPTRYHKIAADTDAIEALFVDQFLDAYAKPPARITLDLDATGDPLHGQQEGRDFHGYYNGYCSGSFPATAAEPASPSPHPGDGTSWKLSRVGPRRTARLLGVMRLLLRPGPCPRQTPSRPPRSDGAQ